MATTIDFGKPWGHKNPGDGLVELRFAMRNAQRRRATGFTTLYDRDGMPVLATKAGVKGPEYCIETVLIGDDLNGLVQLAFTEIEALPGQRIVIPGDTLWLATEAIHRLIAGAIAMSVPFPGGDQLEPEGVETL